MRIDHAVYPAYIDLIIFILNKFSVLVISGFVYLRQLRGFVIANIIVVSRANKDRAIELIKPVYYPINLLWYWQSSIVACVKKIAG